MVQLLLISMDVICECFIVVVFIIGIIIGTIVVILIVIIVVVIDSGWDSAWTLEGCFNYINEGFVGRDAFRYDKYSDSRACYESEDNVENLWSEEYWIQFCVEVEECF